MTTYTIQIVLPSGTQEIQCASDEYILDAALKNRIKLPYSCKAGVCGTCTAQLEKGSVNQDEQEILDEEEIALGSVQVCVAYPTAHCVIRSHVRV
jgi:2Fe-2S type ferredoxin